MIMYNKVLENRAKTCMLFVSAYKLLWYSYSFNFDFGEWEVEIVVLYLIYPIVSIFEDVNYFSYRNPDVNPIKHLRWSSVPLAVFTKVPWLCRPL